MMSTPTPANVIETLDMLKDSMNSLMRKIHLSRATTLEWSQPDLDALQSHLEQRGQDRTDTEALHSALSAMRIMAEQITALWPTEGVILSRWFSETLSDREVQPRSPSTVALIHAETVKALQRHVQITRGYMDDLIQRITGPAAAHVETQAASAQAPANTSATEPDIFGYVYHEAAFDETPPPSPAVSVDVPKRMKPTPAPRHIYTAEQPATEPTMTATITTASEQRSVQIASHTESSPTRPRSPDSLVAQCATTAMNLANARKRKKRIDESLRRRLTQVATHVKCGFCDNPKPHFSDSCRIYTTPQARLARARERNMCTFCTNHQAGACRSTRVPCYHCNDEHGTHHPSLCPISTEDMQEAQRVMGLECRTLKVELDELEARLKEVADQRPPGF
ncbi:hypothetical protein QR680_006822 [Steinernema hermaphroditum]|uniref:Uncharacterized protein n=1 Tax=Steinernema hermaphroditum TaxID=289476 RepID=A0AA39LX42_9BILA|nr:hypothetical protein QR680_006822 [Steinernema hermaphroditum]